MWLSIFFGFIIISLLIVIGFLVKALKVQMDKHAVYEQWILDTQALVNQTYETIKEIDDKGYFKSEDEVGSVFQQLVEAIDYLNKIINNE